MPFFFVFNVTLSNKKFQDIYKSSYLKKKLYTDPVLYISKFIKLNILHSFLKRFLANKNKYTPFLFQTRSAEN